MSRPAIDRFIERMPKVELHLHLEGSMRPATLLELAARRRVHLPADTVEGVRRWFRFADFEEFVGIYLTCCRCLRDPEDFQRLVAELMEEQARQNVVHTEAHFTVGSHVAAGANPGELADALAEAIVDGERRTGVSLRLIPDIVRNTPERADLTVEWALAGRGRGVVALGLSGFETLPARPFGGHFEAAAAAGLHRVAHAGEHGPASSIAEVVEWCGAERIGHGIRALEDPAVVELLRERRLPLEVCPTSNVTLGAAPTVAEHPFDALRRAGLVVTVNSDDPPMFDTTLTGELQALADAFGYDAALVAGLSLAALEHSFLPAERKAELEADFRLRFAGLGEELGLALEA